MTEQDIVNYIIANTGGGFSIGLDNITFNKDVIIGYHSVEDKDSDGNIIGSHEEVITEPHVFKALGLSLQVVDVTQRIKELDAEKANLL